MDMLKVTIYYDIRFETLRFIEEASRSLREAAEEDPLIPSRFSGQVGGPSPQGNTRLLPGAFKPLHSSILAFLIPVGGC